MCILQRLNVRVSAKRTGTVTARKLREALAKVEFDRISYISS